MRVDVRRGESKAGYVIGVGGGDVPGHTYGLLQKYLRNYDFMSI